MVSPRPEWVEYATDREFGLGMIVADSSKLQLSFILDADGQVTSLVYFGHVKNAANDGTEHGWFRSRFMFA